MNPMKIDVAQAAIAARGSTKHWLRARWTEITVYHLQHREMGNKVWLVEVAAHSSVAGERTKTQRLGSSSLLRALKLVGDSDLGISVREAALEYAEERQLPTSATDPVRAMKEQCAAIADRRAEWYRKAYKAEPSQTLKDRHYERQQASLKIRDEILAIGTGETPNAS